MANISYFGIRHHGPGSARRLVQALDALKPKHVLIEGPADANDLLQGVNIDKLKPPVALLCYPKDEPDKAAFWPYAEFSPEYQAIVWARQNGSDLRFIDLPSTAIFADAEAETDEDADDKPTAQPFRDPLGSLAHAAGYEDGESWWSDVIEEGGSAEDAPHKAFDAIEDAVAEMRNQSAPISAREERREAFMRLRIDEVAKETDGAIAVVCGAWHVPALKEKTTQTNDKKCLKGMKTPTSAVTWAPWTSPRLAFASNYGAGVTAPAWYKHLWHSQDRSGIEWLSKIARLLRTKGQIVSTAEIIEATRLAQTLCVMRDKPAPGFEEMRDAAIACLCFGEKLVWHTIETELLIGNDVGEIPDDAPLAPLLVDLQQSQRKARLKPEALARDLAVDLRSESGLYRSSLLQRLNILNVPWGQLMDAGRSRGTFRERWQLAWEPEFAVRLVEHLVHGTTIEKAANTVLINKMVESDKLGVLAGLIENAFIANLQPAIAKGVDVLAQRVTHSDECLDTLIAIPPLANTMRYGEARAIDVDSFAILVERLIVQASIAMQFSARNLDAEATTQFCSALTDADAALNLIEAEEAVLEDWTCGLFSTLDDKQTSPQIAGRVASLLSQRDLIANDRIAVLLESRLSPGVPVLDAAGFFEGFFDGMARQLIYNEGLRTAVTAWLMDLPSDDFTEHMPLFRRVFSDLDSMERKRLLDAVLGKRTKMPTGIKPLDDDGKFWSEHLAALLPILNKQGSAHDT